MGIIEFIVVLFIALLIASVFFYGFRSRGPWGAFWVFLLILFLTGWVGRLWLTPAGPLFFGYAWLPVLVFVLIVALLIAVATPEEKNRNSKIRRTRADTTPSEHDAGPAFGIFFWILLLFLFTAIVAGLFMY